MKLGMGKMSLWSVIVLLAFAFAVSFAFAQTYPVTIRDGAGAGVTPTKLTLKQLTGSGSGLDLQVNEAVPQAANQTCAVSSVTVISTVINGAISLSVTPTLTCSGAPIPTPTPTPTPGTCANPAVKPAGGPPLFPSWMGPKPIDSAAYMVWLKGTDVAWWCYLSANPGQIPSPYVGAVKQPFNLWRFLHLKK